MNRFLPGLLCLALMLASAACGDDSSSDHRIIVPIPATDATGIVAQAFSYASTGVDLDGTVEILATADEIRFRGTYRTRQPVEPDTRLAFHAFSPANRLGLYDGRRTEWQSSGEELVAEFDYRYTFAGLGMRESDDELLIQFDYVKEHAYWYSNRHPDAHLPALFFPKLPRGERFQRLWSWTPHLIPAESPVLSIQVFRSMGTIPGSILKYRAAMRSFFRDSQQFMENRRAPLRATGDAQTHVTLLRLQPDPGIGPLGRGLGLVWEGRQWYAGDNIPRYRTSYVIPLSLYTGISLTLLGVVVACFHRGRRAQAPWLRYSLFAGGGVLAAAYLLEFLSSVQVPLLALAAATAVTASGIRWQTKLYWVVVLFVAGQEIFWSSVRSLPEPTFNGFLISFFLVALFAAPVIWIASRVGAIAYALLGILLAGVCFFSMDLYESFFQDYPALNVLTYAGQVSALSDSIVSLLNERHLLLLLCLLWAIGLAIASLSTRSRPAESAA